MVVSVYLILLYIQHAAGTTDSMEVHPDSYGPNMQDVNEDNPLNPIPDTTDYLRPINPVQPQQNTRIQPQPYVYQQSQSQPQPQQFHSTHISIDGGPGSRIDNQGPDGGQKVDLHAIAPNNRVPKDIHIHLHEGNNPKYTYLSGKDQEDANDITNMAHIQTPKQSESPQWSQCQEYIQKITQLERQKAKMAIRLASLQLKLTES